MVDQTAESTANSVSTKTSPRKTAAVKKTGSGIIGGKVRRLRPKAKDASAAAKLAGTDATKTTPAKKTSAREQAQLAERVEKLKQAKLETTRKDEAQQHGTQGTPQEQEAPLSQQPPAPAPAQVETPPVPESPPEVVAVEPEAPKPKTEPATKVAPTEPAKAKRTAATETAETENEPTRAKPKAAERKRGADTKRSSRSERTRRTNRRLTVAEALTHGDAEDRQRSLAAMRRRAERDRRMRRKSAGGEVKREKVIRDVQIPDTIRLRDLANRMAEPGGEVIKRLMAGGQIATLNDLLDADTAEIIVQEFGHRPVRVSASDVEIGISGAVDSPSALQSRAPVVTVMGHVDHGKTSLLDKIRETGVVHSEAGAITQHIGAYRVETDHGAITFIDTPGHAAFSAMRARGTKVTDIVILVVAANDGVMPQTVEAIAHARAAEVPLVVAINKMDLEGASSDRICDALLEHSVIVEARGGEIQAVEISAKSGAGISDLLEAVLLQASLLDLKANPNRRAEGTVIEARVDKGRGNVATVLVGRGTLKAGDIFVVGAQWGRARALRDERGHQLQVAGPSVPVEIDGLQGLPDAGDPFVVVESETSARDIAKYRTSTTKQTGQAPTLRTGFEQLAAGEQQQQQLPVVIKADVRGSAEAIVNALANIGNDDVSVVVRGSGVGAITESDITLAAASNARVFGFNVRANSQAKKAATQYNVQISYHSVIYELLDEVKHMASGLLAPEIRETPLGAAEIQQVFRVKKVGAIAGCTVTEGVARKDAKMRLVRDGTVMFEGLITTLKRHKDDVEEVRAGTECGMSFRNQQDLRVGDVIEIFATEEIERTL